jgi:hypothetical protein
MRKSTNSAAEEAIEAQHSKQDAIVCYSTPPLPPSPLPPPQPFILNLPGGTGDAAAYARAANSRASLAEGQTRFLQEEISRLESELKEAKVRKCVGIHLDCADQDRIGLPPLLCHFSTALSPARCR